MATEHLPAEDDPQVELEAAVGAVIADRVREFRLKLGWTVGQLAERSGLSKGMLSKIENAQASPSLSTLARLSEALSVPFTGFFRGLAEEQDVIYVKAGEGLDIQHKWAHEGRRYQHLGRMRAPHDHLEPTLVSLTEPFETFALFQHAGTEFIHMLDGEMAYGYGSARFHLAPGDSLQFIGEVAHGPTELVSLPVRFLSIKAVAGKT